MRLYNDNPLGSHSSSGCEHSWDKWCTFHITNPLLITPFSFPSHGGHKSTQVRLSIWGSMGVKNRNIYKCPFKLTNPNAISSHVQLSLIFRDSCAETELLSCHQQKVWLNCHIHVSAWHSLTRWLWCLKPCCDGYSEINQLNRRESMCNCENSTAGAVAWQPRRRPVVSIKAIHIAHGREVYLNKLWWNPSQLTMQNITNRWKICLKLSKEGNFGGWCDQLKFPF